MNKVQKIVRSIFIPPKDPDKRYDWIKTWINSVFVIYSEVINQTEKAQPEKEYKVFRLEAEEARKELLEACDIKRQAEKLLKDTGHQEPEKDPGFSLISKEKL